MNDTICAISTALGVGAISIIRVSGEEAINKVANLFDGKNLREVESHTIHYGHIVSDGEVIDVCIGENEDDPIFTITDFRQYKELFFIGSGKILFTALLIEWFYTGIENFRYIAVRSILIKILYVIMVFVLIRTKEDYVLYFILNASVVILNAFINIVYVRHYVKIQFKELLSIKYVKQNLSLGIYNLMTSMYLTFNVVFLAGVEEEIIPHLKGYRGSVYTIDAKKISMAALGKYFPNTPLLAAIVKVAQIMEKDTFLREMRASFHHKFANKPEVIEGNMKALEMAFEEVH